MKYIKKYNESEQSIDMHELIEKEYGDRISSINFDYNDKIQLVEDEILNKYGDSASKAFSDMMENHHREDYDVWYSKRNKNVPNNTDKKIVDFFDIGGLEKRGKILSNPLAKIDKNS